jgi:glycosyltransferase involved in cell wall biosynthesis
MAITIAIPFFNAEAYLIDAIRSVFAQTYQDWELILIDDGSTDKSLEIAKSIKDDRVRVISDGKNKRLAGRLNEVTKIAKYDFIARMDADDLIFPSKLATQLAHLKKDSNLDIVTTGVYSVTNNLEIQGVRGQDFEYPNFDSIVSRKLGVVHAAILAKKSWYERNQYDESLKIAQDLDLWIRAAKKNDFKIKSISDYLYIYREEGNITKDKLLRAYKNERKMVRKYGSNQKVKLLSKSRFKSLVVRTLAITGNIQQLQKRRGKETISDLLKTEFEKALTTIRNTKIPGIDA